MARLWVWARAAAWRTERRGGEVMGGLAVVMVVVLLFVRAIDPFGLRFLLDIRERTCLPAENGM